MEIKEIYKINDHSLMLRYLKTLIIMLYKRKLFKELLLKLVSISISISVKGNPSSTYVECTMDLLMNYFITDLDIFLSYLNKFNLINSMGKFNSSLF